MKLSEIQIKEFQEIYQKELGESLDSQAAHDRGLHLLGLVQLLLVPSE